MTASLFVLQRHEDPSGVSGTGVVAHGAEFDDGSVALHWPGATPTTSVWSDIRHVEQVHGHGGSTAVEYLEPHRLIAAYEQVTKVFLTDPFYRPDTVGAHPDHPDRLRVTFGRKRFPWEAWVRVLGGSTDTVIHEEVNGEIEHRWVSADGNLWLTYYSRDPVGNSMMPRGGWEAHDDPEENR